MTAPAPSLPSPDRHQMLDPVAVDAIERRLLRGRGLVDVGWLARQVAARMGERLEIIKMRPQRVLDVSGWLGGGADVLRAAYPDAEIHVAERHHEAAARHAEAATPRPWWAPWRAPEARWQVLQPGSPWPGDVNLLWSNLDLHARHDPPAEIARWHESVSVGGFVMFSSLGPDTLRELTEWHAEAGFGPATVPFVDMHDHGDMLVRAGFADPVMDQERLRLTWGDAESLLRDLRSIGGNAHPARFPGLRTPAWRARLLAAVGRCAGSDGRISLTVEVAYGHAFRVDRRRDRPTETTVSVDTLRATARSFPRPSPGGALT
jgi:malonyl-CoA O-methyltransferase